MGDCRARAPVLRTSLLRWAGLALLATAGYAQQRQLRPGWNLFSKEQDIQIGREYASQVEQQVPIVRNAELSGFVERIGRRLAAAPDAGDFPYTFKVVQDKSINAFALPGGPTFTHTGLIAAAENEAQVAGVLAHEIAHDFPTRRLTPAMTTTGIA